MTPLPTQRTDYFALAAGLAAAVVSALLIDLRFGVAVLAGAMTGVFNFSLLRLLVGRILLRAQGDRSAAPFILVGTKFLGLMGILYILLAVVALPVMAFALGFVSTPLAIVIDALIWRNARSAEANATSGSELQ